MTGFRLSLPLIRPAIFFALLVVGFFLFFTNAHAQENLFEQASGCLGNLPACLAGGTAEIINGVLKFIVGLLAAILGLAGAFFNTTMLYTVFNFSRYFGNSEGLLLAWGILRDLANIALLFSFVFIGIQTILNINNFSVGKTLPRLLIFAVLLNFSLFAAEAVVDVSNAVASSFYTQAESVDCRDADSVNECANLGIAAQIFEIAGISTILSPEGWDLEGVIGVRAAFLFLCILIFVIVMFGLFIAASLMLIARAITLMFLFVSSPIGLAGAVLPGLEKFSKGWWKSLIDNALFAPVLVLLMLIGLKVMDGVKTSIVGGNGNLLLLLQAEGPGSTLGFGSAIVLYTLVIGFMFGALLAAKHFGVFGSEVVVGTATKFIGNTAGGLALYPAAWVANGAGRMYNQGARVVRRITPAPLRTVAGLLGGSALDSGIRGVLAAPAKATIPGTGMQSYSDLKKSRRDRADEMRKLDKDQRGKTIKENIGLAGTEAEKESEDRKEYAKQREEDKKNGAILETGSGSPLAETLQKVSFAKLEEHVKESNKNLVEISKNLTPDRFEKLIESKEIAESKKRTLIDERFKEQTEAITSGKVSVIRNTSSKDMELMAKYNARAFEAIVKHEDPATGANMLSDDQQETLSKLTDKLAKNQIALLKENSKSTRLKNAVAAGNTGQAQNWAQNMSPKSYAKVHEDVVTNPAMVATYDPGVLAAIMSENNKLSRAQLQQIGKLVRDVGHMGATQHANIQNYFALNPAAAAHFSP